MSDTDETFKWFLDHGRRLHKELQKSRNLYDAITAIRRVLRADLAAGLLINRRGQMEIIKSVSRPVKPRFESFGEWLDTLDCVETQTMLDDLRAPTTLGRVIYVKESAGADKSLRPALAIIRLRITEVSFPEHIRCAVCLLFEDFGDIFDENDPGSQLGFLSSFLNNWLHRRLSKRTVEPAGRDLEMLKRGWLMDILSITSFMHLLLLRERMAERLKEWIDYWWWTSRDPSYIPEELRGALESGSKKWAKDYRSYDKGQRQESVHAERDRLLWLICYWAWWRGADRGWIGKYRHMGEKETKRMGGKERKSKMEEEINIIEKAITTGLDRLEENEKELQKALCDYFVETTRVARE